MAQQKSEAELLDDIRRGRGPTHHNFGPAGSHQNREIFGRVVVAPSKQKVAVTAYPRTTNGCSGFFS